MQEFKRIFRKKNGFVFIGFAILNLLLFYYMQTRPGQTFSSKQSIARYDELVLQFSELPLQSAAEKAELLYKTAKIDQQTEEMAVTEYLKDKIAYLQQYPESIRYVMENARQMNRFSIFNKPNSFSYYNIQQTIKDFDKMKNQTLSLDNDLAAEAAAKYYGVHYLAFIFVLYILYQMLDERENGMLPMLHAAPGGRVRMGAARQLMIAGLTFGTLFVFYFMTVVFALFWYGGAASLLNPVQTIESFAKYVFLHSKLEYLVVYFFKSALILYALICLVWFALVIFRDRKLVLASMAGIYGLEYLLFTKISIHSVYRMFHHINILSLFSFGDISRKYLNVGIGHWVVSAENIILLACAGVCSVLSVLTAAVYARMRPRTQRVLFERLTTKLREWGQRRLERGRTVTKELYKLGTAGNGVLLIGVLLILTVYFCSDSRMHFSEAQQQLDEKYLEMGGKDYTQLEVYCDEVNTRLLEAQQKQQQLSQENMGAAFEWEKYENAGYELYALQMESRAISEYVTKLDELKQLEIETGIHGYLMSDRGYDEIIGIYSQKRELILLLCLSCVLVLIISEGFRSEYETGMFHLMHAAANGRKWIFWKKCAAGIITATGLFIVTYGIDFLFWLRYYGLPYLEAPVQSLSFMAEYGPEISVGAYLLLRWLLWYVFVMLVTVVVMAAMILAGNRNSKSYITVVLAAALLGAWLITRFGMMDSVYIWLVSGMALCALLSAAVASKRWQQRGS